MKALTLWQPMAWAISDFTKRIENRPWKPWKGVREIAIHAGATYHVPHREQIEDVFGVAVPGKDAVPLKAIVAVASIAGYVHEDDLLENDDPWFSGPYGWLLEDVRKLRTPVACKGERGLWELDPHVERQVLEAL